MSDLFLNLDHMLRQVEGNSVTEIQKGLNELYSTLSSDSVRSDISSNSSSQHHQLTWKVLLLRCHQCLVSLTSKTKDLTRPALSRQALCCKLVTLILRYASTPTCIYLEVPTIMSLVLEILTSSLYSQHHDEYMITLGDCILSNPLYRAQMTLDDWRGLLKVSLDLFTSENSTKSIIIGVLQKIVLYGCQRGNFHQEVLKLLPFIMKLFQDVVSNPSANLNPSYRLLTMIIQEIGTENRRTLCEFTENLLPSVMSVLATGGQERDDLLYHIVILHHPRGATETPNSFANSWGLWRRIMLTILNTIFRELVPRLLDRGFLALGAEVLHQVVVDEAYRHEDIESGALEEEQQLGPQMKRRKIAHSMQTLLDLFDADFTKKTLENRWPVIQLVTEVLRKYPETLKFREFHQMLKLTSELFIESTKEPRVMDTLCLLGRILIQISRSSAFALDSTVHKYWDKIFDNVLITLGKGQNEIEGHKLLQMLIDYRGVYNVNAFVNLYFTNAIKWSNSSVQTLIVLCNHVIILEDSKPNSGRWEGESDRQRLIRWSLEVPGYRVLSPDALEDVCKLVTGLVLKTWDKRFTELHHQGEVDALEFNEDDRRCIDSIQKCHLSLNFETDLFNEEMSRPGEKSEPLKLSIAERNFQFCLGMITELLDFPGELPDDVTLIISRLTLVAKCLSNFLELEVESQELESLISEFSIHFFDVLEMMCANKKLERDNAHVVGVIRALVTLFSSRYHKRIAKIVLETPKELLTNLFLMLNFEEESEPSESRQLGIKYYERIFEVQITPEGKHSQITIGTHQVLTAFSLLQTGSPVSERQIKVLQNLLQKEIYKTKLLVNLWKGLALLKSILRTPREFFLEGLLAFIGNFILDLFQLWDKDFHGVKGILELLPGFVELFSRTNIDYEGLLGVLKASVKPRDKGYSGPLIQTTFLEAAHRIMKLQPSSSPRLMPPNELFRYIGSDLYLVRLYSLRILHLMFSSDEVHISHKKSLFERIEEIVMSDTKSIFVVNQNLTGTPQDDEFTNRTVTALYLLGTVVHASGIFHPQALNLIFRLHTNRNLDINLIKKLFAAVIPREKERLTLIRNNLYDLMKTGMQEGVSMGDFWMMTNCSSEVEFYENHIGIFILIKLEIQEFHKVEVLCKNLGVSFAKAIEDNFPGILSWMLAAMVRQKSLYVDEIYVKLRENSGSFRHVRQFSELLEEKLAEVVLDLLQRLHDREHFKDVFQVPVYFPKMIVPNFRYDIIVKALEQLQMCVMGEKGSLVQYLIVKHPEMVQRILSTLVKSIHDQTMVEYRLKAFHHYSFFCQQLMSEISEEYFNEMSTFVVRDVSYTLIHLLHDTNELFLDIVFDFLHQFLKKLLPSRSREVSGILNYLSTNLISMVQSSKMKAIKILKLLVVESTEVLQESIRILGVFPNSQEFDEIRGVYNSLKKTHKTWSLKIEMEHFLNSAQEKTLSCSVEGIVHLRKQLGENRDELQRMYKDLEELRGFAEDCTSSVLHRLTYRLIKLTESSNVSIGLEATRCLGELGPTDLTTMILHPEEGHLQESAEAIDVLTETIISKLSDRLIEDSLELREAAADALYEVFSSPWGQQIIKKFRKDLGKPSITSSMLTILRNTRPFLVRANNRTRTVELDEENCAICFVHGDEIWKGEGGESYVSWIRKLTCAIINCFKGLYTSALVPVCKIDVEFCESILPRMIFLLISTADELLDFVCKCINSFFEGYFEAACSIEQTMSQGSLRVEAFSHESVRCMLKVVNFLRIQSSSNFESKLNYLPIAKAAQYCSAYFTSLLYAELSSETMKRSLRQCATTSLIDGLCEVCPSEGKALQEILREAYLKIGDPDSIHGCGQSHLKSQSSRIQHYLQFNQWDIAMTAQDVELSSGFPCSRGMITALQQTGLDYLLSKYLSTIKNEENVEEYMYETAWRLSNWGMLSKSSTTDYEYHHYHSLKYLQERDTSGVRSSLERARLSIISSLRNTSLECSQTVYPKLLKLQMLRELEELNEKSIEHWPEVITDWRQQNLSNINDFQYIEPILSQRIALFKIGYSTRDDPFLKNSIVETYLELSRVAQAQGHLHLAGRALESLGRTPDLTEDMRDSLNLREAVLAWTRGDQTMARFLLRNLIAKPGGTDPRLLSQGLRLWGNWMAETKSEGPQVVEDHYQKSIDIIQSIQSQTSEDFRHLNDTRAALAQFADAQYEHITEFMKTPLFESLQQTARFVREGNFRAKQGDKNVISAMNKNERTDKNDFAEYEKIQREQSTYLKLAVKYYCRILIDGDYNNFLVFRLVSLWFKNMDRDEVNSILESHLHLILTHKFVPLIPQLAPHVSLEGNYFSKMINSLVERCAREHPHHVLPVLLSLRNTNKDNEFQKKKTAVAPVRVLAAKRILEKLERTDIRGIIEEMTRTAEALMMLAYYSDKNRSGVEARIPTGQQILRIKGFERCMVPTINLKVQPGGNYQVVGIRGFKEVFETLGGVNAPKKIYCLGADGVVYKQVIKVDADIKNDSIMQQVFTVMNSLFQSSKETKRRKLRIRTYKVVSLSQQSGILQWCDNTIPMSSVLVGSGGLHGKYHVGDWKPDKCRKLVDSVSKRSNEERLKIYLQICENFRPAFQYFFLEKFPSPETWFERRMAYTRSIATTSMVGYILGLGDRHCSNILIDETTAEVVHIDFGIAFEQGKVLPIPETIPFRLTRELEAAMGVSGVEGVMRRCCEETMSVLRDRREMIITLLQVLIYDPLFSWSISPYKAYKMQSEDSTRFTDSGDQDVRPTNKMAERALLRIDQKLHGTEEGIATSIAGQVERLIQQARDPGNLSRIFYGWQAYL